jgi:hypothetical protein
MMVNRTTFLSIQYYEKLEEQRSFDYSTKTSQMNYVKKISKNQKWYNSGP